MKTCTALDGHLGGGLYPPRARRDGVCLGPTANAENAEHAENAERSTATAWMETSAQGSHRQESSTRCCCCRCRLVPSRPFTDLQDLHVRLFQEPLTTQQQSAESAPSVSWLHPTVEASPTRDSPYPIVRPARYASSSRRSRS